MKPWRETPLRQYRPRNKSHEGSKDSMTSQQATTSGATGLHLRLASLAWPDTAEVVGEVRWMGREL